MAKTEAFDFPARLVSQLLFGWIFGSVVGMAVGEFVADIAFYIVGQGSFCKKS